MSHVPAARQFRSRCGTRLCIALGFVLATACAVAFTVDAFGLGHVFYGGAAIVLVTVFCLSPILRGVRPLQVWAPQTLAGACFILSFTANYILSDSPESVVNTTYVLGYALLVVWLGALAVHLGRQDESTILDTIAVTVGALLLVWVIMVVPMAAGAMQPRGVALGVYPATDLTLLALAVNLSRRLHRTVPALQVFILVLTLQLGLDLAYAAAHLFAPEWVRPLLACYLFAYLGYAIAAGHPSVVELQYHPVDDERGSRRPTALILFTISPAILATSVPLYGSIDAIARPTLVTVLLVLVFVRLTRTMQALTGSEARSRHRAAHDPLTGLLNRSSLFETLTRRLGRNARGSSGTAVVFVDCDDFKHVNDTWGHTAGDDLLRQVATRLAASLAPGDALARHGGDEFVVVADVPDQAAALALTDRMRASLREPLVVNARREHTVTITVGAALALPTDEVDAHEMLRRADVAMYEAKARATGQVVFFDEALAESSRIRATLGDRLATAIAEEQFRVHLQPIRGGAGFDTTLAWEALLRWDEPELGPVSPEVFIGLAEELGLIRELGELAMREACAGLARIRRECPRVGDVAVSVNVSPAQLLDPGFTEMVRRCAREAGLPLHAVWLEVTETMLVDTAPHVLEAIRDLRRQGVIVLIDDFGTGYASLSTLLRLPVDDVKLDRSLVARLGQEEAATRQLAAVMALVRSLGIDNILAEGVETPDQAVILEHLGCPLAQGWLFGRPAPVDDVISSLSHDAVR